MWAKVMGLVCGGLYSLAWGGTRMSTGFEYVTPSSSRHEYIFGRVLRVTSVSDACCDVTELDAHPEDLVHLRIT